MSVPQTPEQRSPDPRSRRDLDLAYTNTATMLSGLVVWGGIGWLIDHALGFTALFLPILGLAGLAAATYLVVQRSSHH